MYGVRWGKRWRQYQSLTYHAQIPLSAERQIAIIERQIDERVSVIPLNRWKNPENHFLQGLKS